MASTGLACRTESGWQDRNLRPGVEANVLNGADERDRCLLPGLVPEILAVTFAICRNFTHCRDRSLYARHSDSRE